MRGIPKSAISLSLCVLLAFSTAACKGGTSKVSGQSSKEPVTIKWLAYQTLAQPDPNSAIVQADEKKFNAKFDFMYVDANNWDDQLNVKLSAGDLPDVMQVTDQNHIAKYVQQGILAELPVETIKKKAPDYAKTVSKYDKLNIMWNYCTVGGKNYGFANFNVNLTYPNPIVWRTDWLKNVGISQIPSTLSEFEDAMLKFRNNDPDQDGKKDTYGMSNTILGDIFAAYGITNPLGQTCELMNQNGKIVFAATTSQAKQAVTELAKLYQEGSIDPEYVTGEHTTGYWAISNAFDNGRIGVTASGSFYHWNPPLYDGDPGAADYQDLKKMNPNAQYGFGKPIVGPTGKVGATMANYTAAPIGITVQGAKKAGVVDTTLAMLNAAYSDDKNYFMLNNWGTEGTDYTVNSAGVYSSKITTAADARKKGILVLTCLGQNPDLLKQTNEPLYKWADQNFTYTGIATPVFSPSSDYMAAVAQYGQNLQKLTVQAYTDMITGKTDVSTAFDAYVKQFNANGGTAVEKAANAKASSK